MRKILTYLGVAAAAFALLASWASFTAVVALVDLRSVALWASLAALGIAALARSRGAAILALIALVTVVAVLYVPITAEDVQFRGTGGVTLTGTLYRPRTREAVPALVYLHGSGPQKRGDFRWYALQLAREGIASLIYDKRTGSGAYAEYAADGAAAIATLRARPGIRADAVGLLGHSEGGWIAPAVATMVEPPAAFVVVTSTTNLTPASQVAYETMATMREAGHAEDVVRHAEALQMRVLEYQRTGSADPDLASNLAAAAKQPWFDAAELPDQLYPPDDYAWWRSVMDYDPLPFWRRVDAPVLAISGGRDRNSDVRASQAAIREALAAGGNHDFTGRIYPEMVHGGVEWWLPYGLPPPRYPSGYDDLLASWISAKTARATR